MGVLLSKTLYYCYLSNTFTLLHKMEVVFPGRSPIKVDIIFVHGLRGDSRNTWTLRNVFWPKDLLSNDLPESRIMSWGYDSSVANQKGSSSQNSIFGHATNLLRDISIERKTSEEVGYLLSNSTAQLLSLFLPCRKLVISYLWPTVSGAWLLRRSVLVTYFVLQHNLTWALAIQVRQSYVPPRCYMQVKTNDLDRFQNMLQESSFLERHTAEVLWQAWGK